MLKFIGVLVLLGFMTVAVASLVQSFAVSVPEALMGVALQGLLVVDDVLFHGDVLNERPTSAKGAGVRGFLEQVERRPGYQKLLLPIGNGVMLMRKEA